MNAEEGLSKGATDVCPVCDAAGSLPIIVFMMRLFITDNWCT